MSNVYLGSNRAELLQCLTQWRMKLIEKPDANGLQVINAEIQLIKSALEKCESSAAVETKVTVTNTAD